MKILAISQARIGSSRFPEKILKTIHGESLLEIHLKRVLQSQRITKLKVATTIEPDAYKIVAIAAKLGVEAYKGSVNDVLDRFYKTAFPEKPDWVVRLTSDCPLIDPMVIDRVIDHALTHDLDYVSNTLKPTFPDGVDVEIFKYPALVKARTEAKLTSEREHVTPYIWKNSSFNGGIFFSSDCVVNEKDFSDIRLTVDSPEDYLVIEKLIEILGTGKSWTEYVSTLENHPEIKRINADIQRNEGYLKSLNSDKNN